MFVVGIRSKSPQFRYKYFTPYAESGKEGYGSAGEFLRFMKDELMPSISSNYKTGGQNVLAGHSLAGLFALYAIAESAGTFTHVIAASPSVPYENGVLFNYIDKLKSSKDEKLYFSVAENDVNGYRTEIEKFKDQLSSGNWKNWKYEMIESTNHYSTAPLSFYKGLLYLFND